MKPNQFKTEGMKKGKDILWGIAIFSMVCLLNSVPRVTFAQEKYPTRAINFILGYPAGGMTDTSARPLVSAASKILGQPVVVVNKPGGGSVVAMASLKNEKPDGYTIGSLTTGGTLSQYMRKVPYDSAKDFTPIMQYVIHLYGLVLQTDSPWKTFKEFIEFAKANPGKIRYSTAGPGTPQHLVMERLALLEKIKWTHIPFEGGGPAVAALLGGHVEACSQTTEWKKQVEAGRLRGLALYAEKRASGLPQIPTLMEMGYDLVAPGAICIIGPKGLPPHIVETLLAAFKKALEDPDYIRVCKETDQVIAYRGPQDLARYLAETHEVWGGVNYKAGFEDELEDPIMPSVNNDQVSGALWLILGLGIILASIPYGLGALASPGTGFLSFLAGLAISLFSSIGIVQSHFPGW